MREFTFDQAFQRAVLRLMQIDDAFMVRAQMWLDASMFTSKPHGWMFKAFVKHWQAYSMRCTELPLMDLCRGLPEDKRAAYTQEAERVIQLGEVPERDWIRERLVTFVKQSIFARAHTECATPFNRGDQETAYRIMAEAMERIHTVEFEAVQRSWLYDDLQSRQQQRLRKSMLFDRDRITTGIPELDQKTDGGVHRGELWSVFAYAKRCKTTWLINQGFNATRVHQRKTLHVLLEGRLDQVCDRYDACHSGELYSVIRQGELSAALYHELEQEYQALRSLLVVRRLDGWDNTIDDIRAELQQLKGQGFTPDVLITDYMDLGRKRDAGRNETEVSHQIGFARDLKRLHENENLAGWSAWQAQRPEKGAHTREHVLTSSSVADCYAKVRIVSAYGSLNATDEEMAEGTMRVFMEAHRDAAVNQVWTITNDLGRQRMATSVQEAPVYDYSHSA